MRKIDRLPLALLALRLSVFVVMLVWTVGKFVAPAHAAAIFGHFYGIADLPRPAIYATGLVELAVLVGFVLGYARRVTYGAVLVFHGASTLASFPMYLHPARGELFFAAWPMLAACFTLYVLRDFDTLGTLRPKARHGVTLAIIP